MIGHVRDLVYMAPSAYLFIDREWPRNITPYYVYYMERSFSTLAVNQVSKSVSIMPFLQ